MYSIYSEDMQHYNKSSVVESQEDTIYTASMSGEKKNKYRLTVQLQKEEEDWMFDLRVALLRQHRTLKDFVLEAIEAKNREEQIIKAKLPKLRQA
jgi:hypothetical protein